MELSNSNKLKTIGKTLLPGLAQTFSKSPKSFVEGVYPVYAEKAEGCYFYDVDNNKFIDYLMGLGPVVLGYNYKTVNDAIVNQLKNGISFSLPHKLEIEVAEKLKKNIPCAEMTRFTKTGSDAVTGAVRAARAITKKDIIVYCGSGGVWHDWFSIATSRNIGIPKFNKNFIKLFDYNNIQSLEEIFKQFKNKIAAVIMEPAVYEKPKKNFLKNVKKIAHENNSLLIFDEILTGFRMSIGGGQKYFGVTPDMATFAKGLANGMPLGAIVGKTEYMKIFEDVFVSTTYAGETLSLAASLATIKEFEKKDVCGKMWEMASIIKNEFNKNCKEIGLNGECVGFYPRLKYILRDHNGMDSLVYKSFFLQNLIEDGIFMHPNVILLSYSHSKKDIRKTVDSISKSLIKLKKAINSNTVNESIHGNIAKEVIRILK